MSFSYSVVSYLYVSCSGLRRDFLLLVIMCSCSEEFPCPFVFGTGSVISLWHSLSLPYNYIAPNYYLTILYSQQHGKAQITAVTLKRISCKWAYTCNSSPIRSDRSVIAKHSEAFVSIRARILGMSLAYRVTR